MNLKLLMFDLTSCFCSSGCCRTEIIKILLLEMGQDGPCPHSERRHALSYILNQFAQGSQAPKVVNTNVVVKGLISEAEANIVHDEWESVTCIWDGLAEKEDK